uniref:Cytochrome P450 4461L1 n=1 Tax=Maconellicoccus hirsutus TaxID=177089 RepID=A0AAT9UTV2_MACHI
MNYFFKNVEKHMQSYDRLVFWMSSYPCVVLKKQEDISLILSQCQDRESLGFLNEWFGTGILTLKYDEWKKSRKTLAPAFTSEMLAIYVHVFNERSAALVDKFKSAADAGLIIDVWDHVMNTNVDIITENVLGASIQSTGKIGHDFSYAIKRAIDSTVKRILSPWLHSRIVYWIYLKLTGESELIKKFHDLPTYIVTKKLNDFRTRKSHIDEINSSKRIIDLLIKAHFNDPFTFTETRIRDELISLMGAGTETTTTTVVFTMLMLAIHQDIQQKVYEEFAQLIGNQEITVDHFTKPLKYLEQCIAETSRLYSQITLTARKTTKECKLHDNTIVPDNVIVFLLTSLVHYEEKYYKSSRTWDPENFNEQAVAARPKSSVLTFGYGARSCLGNQYSMLLAKSQLIHILRNYHLSTNIQKLTRDDLEMDLLIKSKFGYPIKFVKRTGPVQK